MSMNLMWEKRGEKRLIDLPFQSTTELTYAILDKKENKDNQMELFEEFFIKRLNLKNPEDIEWRDDVMEMIREKLFDEDYQLVMI